jgi:apolipoprotein N-acyltransferase
MTPAASWRARIAAVAAGLAAGLAHPPFGILVGLLGFAALAVLLTMTGARPLRSAFFRGWLAGVGYFSVSVWWVVEPFMVDAANQAWMAPFALVLMAGGLALFWALAGLAYRLIAPRPAFAALVFAGCFAGFEWLRGHVFTGFPWNLPGETWAAGSAPSQAAAVLGAYGLTWATLALASAPAIVFSNARRNTKAAIVACAAIGLAGLYGLGAQRLAKVASPSSGAPMIRIVQADIDQKEKWRAENLGVILDTYSELTRQPAAARPDIVIWPEGALPAVIDDLVAPGSPYAPRLAAALDEGQVLLMGANRAERAPGGETAYFNSLVAFRRDGERLRPTAYYDKHRLVPFGEFLPYGELATRFGVRSLVHMPSDFTPGPEPRPMTDAGVPSLQPLICYEALFPGFTRAAFQRSGVRPAWILNVSNDAWFGVTSGPLQHLNMAAYRAIEEGLPMVRATPTGVSAVLDAYGRVLPGKRLGLGELGVIDAALPPVLAPTFFARFGDLSLLIFLLISGTAALLGREARPRINLGTGGI